MKKEQSKFKQTTKLKSTFFFSFKCINKKVHKPICKDGNETRKCKMRNKKYTYFWV